MPRNQWHKGKPKTGGRTKGTPNKATLEIRELAQAILTRPAYQTNLRRLADRGKLPPHLETLLYHYAWGKPKEIMEHTGKDGGPLSIQVYLPDNARG